MNRELLAKTEAIKRMLATHATGGAVDPQEYAALRRALVRRLGTGRKLPRFVLACDTLPEFWGYIGNNDERRRFINAAFEQLVELLSSFAQADDDCAVN